jgi:hypothetical protein
VTRIVAVVVAIGLIVGAVFVRRALDDDGNGSSDPTTDDPVALVCAIELERACNALDEDDVEVTIEDAADTAAALVGGTAEVDVWAVPAPWPAMVDDARVRAGLAALFSTDDAPVARSPLAIVGPDELVDCGWRCLGDRAASGLDLGGPAPSSGLGALQVGAFATGWFGTDDFATNDFDAAFTTWLDGVVSATVVTDQPVTRLLQSQAFFDVALSFEADAQAQLDGASADRSEGLALLYPAPVAYLDVLVVGVGDAEAGDVPEALGAALLDVGWQPPSPDGNGLPRPGVLLALQEVV